MQSKWQCVFVLLLNASEGIYRPAKFERVPYKNLTCGKDQSPISVVYEGVGKIDTYPWMGYLIYPLKKKRYTTAVILVTKQMVLGTAPEIDKLPKIDFRANAKVVLGGNCSGLAIPLRDYSFHPDYATNTYSALALIQLETDHLKIELQPICPPPTHLIEPQIFTMALSDNCKKPVVKLYEMVYVSPEKCRAFYRKSGLDISSMWPTYTACAKAISGGECIWRSGAALVLKQGGRWRLLGFGVYGPGCGAPSRFIDYGMLHLWVRRSVLNIGRPAISRVSQNEVVLRRSLSNLQRYGPCDPEERHFEIYTDRTKIYHSNFTGAYCRVVRYNVTIYAGIEYSCVVFRASSFHESDQQPRLFLRRWCVGAQAMCLDVQFVEIDFYVEIRFRASITYEMKAYGRQAKVIDVPRALKYLNRHRSRPYIGDGAYVIQDTKQDYKSNWVYSKKYYREMVDRP